MITFLLGSILGFIGGVLFGRRNVRTVEAALLDAKMIGNEILKDAQTQISKLKEELEQAKEKKTPRKKKEQS